MRPKAKSSWLHDCPPPAVTSPSVPSCEGDAGFSRKDNDAPIRRAAGSRADASKVVTAARTHHWLAVADTTGGAPNRCWQRVDENVFRACRLQSRDAAPHRFDTLTVAERLLAARAKLQPVTETGGGLERLPMLC
jgi:hypothetical protein